MEAYGRKRERRPVEPKEVTARKSQKASIRSINS